MSRELLKRALRFMEVVGCSNDDVCQLCDEIQMELENPEPEPMLLVNVWAEKGNTCFNIEWTKNPIFWPDGKYKLYINQSTPQHQTHSEQS